MKKVINFIYFFILLVTLFSGAFFIGETENKVKADWIGCSSDTFLNYDNKEVCISGGDKDYVKITKEGKITINYEWENKDTNKGFAYLIVDAAECSKYVRIVLNPDSDIPEYGDYALTDKGLRQCSGTYTKNRKVFYMSGERAKKTRINGKINTHDNKSLHLFNYYDYDALVQVKIYYGFYSGTQTLAACEYSSGISGCVSDTTPNIKDFIKGKVGGIEDDKYSGIVEYIDKRTLAYEANNGSGDTSPIIVSLENTSVGEAKESVDNIIYDTIIPTLLAVLGIVATVTIVALGYQIVKEADDAEQRSQNIHRIRNILIGIGVAFIILLAMEPIIKLVQKLLEG